MNNNTVKSQSQKSVYAFQFCYDREELSENKTPKKAKKNVVSKQFYLKTNKIDF